MPTPRCQTFLLLALLLCGACDGRPVDAPEETDDALARVGDAVIGVTDFEAWLAAQPARHRPRSHEGYRSALDGLVNSRLMRALADELGVTANESFKARLASVGQASAQAEAGLIRQALLIHMRMAAPPDEKALQAYYTANRARFLTTRYMIDELRFDDADTAFATAERLRQREHSEDGLFRGDVEAAVTPRKLGWVTRTSMPRESRAALAGLHAGQPVSRVVKTADGARVYLLRGLDKNAPRPLADVRSQLLSEMTAESARGRLDALLAGPREKVSINEPRFDAFVQERLQSVAPRTVRTKVPGEKRAPPKGGH